MSQFMPIYPYLILSDNPTTMKHALNPIQIKNSAFDEDFCDQSREHSVHRSIRFNTFDIIDGWGGWSKPGGLEKHPRIEQLSYLKLYLSD